MIERARARGPGIAKVARPSLVGRRSVELVSLCEGPWRGAIERADVVSEGRSQRDADGFSYFGSTSMLFKLIGAGGDLRPDEVAFAAAALRADPHVRLRALRIAHREATQRASAALGPMHAELFVQATTRGVELTIEVNARHRRSRAKASHR